MEGWIKLHRKLKNNPIYKNSKAVHCWIECLMRASHKEETFYLNRKKLAVKAGEFITGRKEFSKEVSMSASTAWFWLQQFKVDRMVDIKTSNKYSLIVVLNWKKYQEVDSKVDSKWTTNEQQMNTYKNVKNDKKKRNIIKKNYSSLEEITDKDIQEIAEGYKTSVGFVRLQFEKLKNYCQAKGKIYKNYKSALRNFVLGEIQRQIERRQDDKYKPIDARNIK